MAWFDRDSQEPNWVWLLTISRERLGRKNYSYQLNWNQKFSFDEKKVFEKFLKELDSPELVTIEEPRVSNVDLSMIIYGGRQRNIETINFLCLEEEISKINTDEPVRFYCCTDLETDNKERFIEVIKLFMED